MLQFLKKKWMYIAGALVAFLLYRNLTAKIDTVAENTADSQPSGGASMAGQIPLYYANAGGYSGVSGSTESVGGSSDGLSQALLSALESSAAANTATDMAALAAATATATQSTALNSAVSTQVGDAFKSVLSTFMSNPGSGIQTLNLTADPTASGGISITGRTDINLAAAPTLTQQANYSAESIFGSGNNAALNSLITTPAPTYAAPKQVPTDYTKKNFDAVAFLAANPDLANRKISGAKVKASNAYAFYKKFGAQEGRAFTALNYRAA